jgi:hypothetical protein
VERILEALEQAGEPVHVVRVPGDGALYTQFSTGGSLHYTPLPEELQCPSV